MMQLGSPEVMRMERAPSEPDVVEDLTSRQSLDGVKVLVCYAASYGAAIGVSIEGAYIGGDFVEAHWFADWVIQRWGDNILEEIAR